MAPHETVGSRYAQLLEEQLNAAIQKKLDETSSFKKKIAGILSVDDAKSKGYAPDNSQIGQMKACIMHLASAKYADPSFCGLPTDSATSDLISAFSSELHKLNQLWQQERKFAFDAQALKDLAAEASLLIKGEHEAAKKRLA